MRTPIAFFVLSLSLAWALPAAADEWTKSFSVSDGASIRLETNDGRVSVTSWDRPEIAIHVRTEGWKIGTQVKVDATQDGSSVTFSAHVPSMSFMMFTDHWFHIEVSVPRHCDVDVRTSDGAVSLEQIHGRVLAKTSDGRISATDLSGDIELRTSDGGIGAHGLDGRLAAGSGDGSISVSGRFDSLDLSSSDGRITARAEGGSKLADGWNLDASDGSISLRIPGDLKADLDASTGDGGITVDIPVQVQGEWHAEHRRLNGTLNGGGPPLRVRTADGSIRIEKI